MSDREKLVELICAVMFGVEGNHEECEGVRLLERLEAEGYRVIGPEDGVVREAYQDGPHDPYVVLARGPGTYRLIPEESDDE